MTDKALTDWYDNLSEPRRRLVMEYGEEVVKSALKFLPDCTDKELERFLALDRARRQS